MSDAPQRTPNLYCLTGGIASGKTRVQQWLEARGWAAICTDAIVHELYSAGQPLASELAREFGPAVLGPDGSVNRKELGHLTFGDDSVRQRLNALVHPKVREVWQARAAARLAEGKKTVVVIPLAYEVGMTGGFAEVWVAACRREEQLRRLRERGFSEAQAAQRLAAQWPLQKKVDLADRVIWTDVPWPQVEAQLHFLIAA